MTGQSIHTIVRGNNEKYLSAKDLTLFFYKEKDMCQSQTEIDYIQSIIDRLSEIQN